MLWNAFTSIYHWSKIGEPVNVQRGEWLISHVYAVLGIGKEAVRHAEKCLKLTETLKLKGFDLAYAYECSARAYAVAGDKDKFDEFFKKAQEAGEKIENADDKKLFFSDLNSEPWNGMK